MTYFRWLSQSQPSRANKSRQFPSRRGRRSIFHQWSTIGESDIALRGRGAKQENSLPDVWGEDANEWTQACKAIVPPRTATQRHQRTFRHRHYVFVSPDVDPTLELQTNP